MDTTQPTLDQLPLAYSDDTTQTMSSDSDSTPIANANAPFDDPNSDIILQTSDNVHFRVYKLILSLASPFFKHMFTLPQPMSVDSKPSQSGDVIPVSEDSKTLEKVLLFCYPGSDPTFDALSDVQYVLAAMLKYDMREAAKTHVARFVEGEPLRVFAIACRYRWVDVAGLAAKELLKHPLIGAYVEELEFIPAGVYHRFLQYHSTCGNRAASVTSDLTWLQNKEGWVWFECRSESCPVHSFQWTLQDDLEYSVRAWFIDYLQAAGDVVKERPASRWIFASLFEVPFLQKAARCGNLCRNSAHAQLTAFATHHFAPEIDRVLAEVCLTHG